MNDTTNLVYIDDNKPVTTSELIAKLFNKEHFHVLRDIKELLGQLDDENDKSNFGLVKETIVYTNNEGVQKTKQIDRAKHYIITRDGFMLLCIGYTGKTALQIKRAYIKAFNSMYETLVNQQYSLQKRFNEADYKYLLVSGYASEAGKALNHLGKNVKPACKAERDQLFNELQPSLFECKGVSEG